MSRPQPHILAEIPQADYDVLVVTKGELYCVLYKNKPFNLYKENTLKDGKRYMRTSFPSKGHALNMARKLNHYTKSQDYSVKKITDFY